MALLSVFPSLHPSTCPRRPLTTFFSIFYHKEAGISQQQHQNTTNKNSDPAQNYAIHVISNLSIIRIANYYQKPPQLPINADILSRVAYLTVIRKYLRLLRRGTYKHFDPEN